MDSEMFEVVQKRLTPCKSKYCNQRGLHVTCNRSMKCVSELLLFQSTQGPSPDRQPRGLLQRKRGSVEELNHSCLSGKCILTSPQWGSDERGRTVTCMLSVTDTHTAYRIPGLVWTALARSAIRSSAPTFHPVSHWANISHCWQRQKTSLMA